MPNLPAPDPILGKSGTQRVLEAQDAHYAQDDAVQAQLRYLADQITKLEARLPTPGEMAYLQQRASDAETMEKMRALIRKHLPWVIPLGGVIGWAFVALATNVIKITPRG